MADESKGFVRVDDVAGFVGVTVRRIQQLTQEGIIKSERPNDGKGGKMYNFLPTVRSLLTFYREKSDKKSAPSEALNDIKLAEAELKLRKLEAETTLAEGNAHSTEDVRRVWNDVIGSFKMRLHAFPQIASTKLVNIPDRDTASEILRDEVNELIGLLIAYSPAAFYVRNPDYEDEENTDEEPLEETE